MIIGDKGTFGVEFEFSKDNPGMGYGKLWIHRNFYGTIEDLIYLKGYLTGLLENLINAPIVDFDFKKMNRDELLIQLAKRSEDNWKFKISSWTFTDDFNGYKFRDFDDIFLLWQLFPNANNIFNELKTYGNEIHFYSIEKSKIETVLEELNREIKRKAAHNNGEHEEPL